MGERDPGPQHQGGVIRAIPAEYSEETPALRLYHPLRWSWSLSGFSHGSPEGNGQRSLKNCQIKFGAIAILGSHLLGLVTAPGGRPFSRGALGPIAMGVVGCFRTRARS